MNSTGENSGLMSIIRRNYDKKTLIFYKKYCSTIKIYAMNSSRMTFLMKNKKASTTPRFILDKLCVFDSFKKQDLDDNCSRKLTKFQSDFCIKFLNLEIDICSLKKRQLNTKLKELEGNLHDILNENHFRSILEVQQSRLQRLLNKNNERMKHKFDKIFDTQVKKEINFNLDACLNLSNKDVPSEMIEILSLGENFSLPTSSKKKIPLMKMLSEINSIITKEPI